MDQIATPSLKSPRRTLTNRLLLPLARAWLLLMRIKVVGALPDLPKYVIIAAPHTTNWDLPHALAAGIELGVAIHWMGKDSLFKWPYGGVMRWLGGIPVDRSKRNNAVQQIVEMFKASDRLVVVIPPEGTRSDVKQWKSGFYHIAHGAGVPIVLAYANYTKGEIGVAQVYWPVGDYDADLARIQAVYAAVAPRPQTA